MIAFDIVVTLTFLSELIVTLFLSYKNRTSIFRTALVLIVVTGIYLLTQLDNVPSFVYMLIAGLAAIYAIYLSIKKYLKNDYEKEQKEIEERRKEKEQESVEKAHEYIYCTACGTRLDKDASFCTNCGEKVEK
jgi:ABC-type nickel/cobalt efflux system permease component RcnA